MNSKQMMVLLRAIIDLSGTLDILGNKSKRTEEETIALDNAKKVFLALCEVNLSADVYPITTTENTDLYHSSGLSKELYTR